MLLVMLWSFEKYCCAVVLHSRLSTRKLSRTAKEKTVSICLNVAGNRHVFRSCLSGDSISEQAQYNISISKTPKVSTTVKRGLPDLPVRDLWASEYPPPKESFRRSNNELEMAGAVRVSSGCGVSLGVGSCEGSPSGTA
jgi:hypothetical protein